MGINGLSSFVNVYFYYICDIFKKLPTYIQLINYNEMKNNVRVFWAIDNQILVKGFQSLLHSEVSNFIVNETLSNKNILNYSFNETTDSQSIIILQMPLCRSESHLKMYKFLKSRPWLKVVILMDQFDFKRTQFLFNLGVSGVIFEDISETDFISVMRKVLEDKKGIPSYIKERIIEEYCARIEEFPINHSDSPIETLRYKSSDFSKKLFALTKREKEVLKLICEGKMTREIAGQLFISLHTIETHRRNILNKMEVKNTAEMVKVAVVNGLVPVS